MTATTVSDPAVVDSSGWLEYLTDGPKAASFAPYLERNQIVLVPAVVIYEVRKVLLSRHYKTLADAFYSQALRKTIVAFDDVLAVKSAELSLGYKLAMADAMIYATAQHCSVPLVTSDTHFANLPGVTLL